ncbi:MAG TPA: MBL fold metallo-hydrolase [Trueperaceae bacterium]
MSARSVATGVWCLPLESSTLPPFDTTNTYLVAHDGVGVIIDPGFNGEGSIDELGALVDGAGVRLVKAVLLTHTHGDHTGGLDSVASRFDEPTLYVHPLELPRLSSDRARALTDERVLTVGDLTIRALHTPGHSPGHLCFHLPDSGVVLCGDLVAGGASVWVGVPEGDMKAYLASLERIADIEGLQTLGPGHGDLIGDPKGRLDQARDHRLDREEQVLLALEEPLRLEALREAVYGDLAEGLRGPAEATLLAHLQKLMSEMRVVHLGEDETGPFVVRR